MTASTALVDKYKKACSLASDNACAASLGVSRSAVSLWRNGKGHPEADSIERMCIATGESVAHWLHLIEAERARTPAARKVWLRLAQAAASLLLVVTAAGSQRVEAHTNFAGDHAMKRGATSIHYAQLWLRRMAGTARAWLAALLPHGLRTCPAGA